MDRTTLEIRGSWLGKINLAFMDGFRLRNMVRQADRQRSATGQSVDYSIAS